MMLIRTRWLKVSRRGALLTLFGIVFVLLGYSYLHIPAQFKPQLNASLRFALSLAPIEVYAWFWIVCGALAMLGGIIHRFDAVGFGAAVFMPTVWSLANFVAQIQDGVPRAWVGGMVYALIAVVLGVVAGMADPLDVIPERAWWR